MLGTPGQCLGHPCWVLRAKSGQTSYSSELAEVRFGTERSSRTLSSRAQCPAGGPLGLCVPAGGWGALSLCVPGPLVCAKTKPPVGSTSVPSVGKCGVASAVGASHPVGPLSEASGPWGQTMTGRDPGAGQRRAAACGWHTSCRTSPSECSPLFCLDTNCSRACWGGSEPSQAIGGMLAGDLNAFIHQGRPCSPPTETSKGYRSEK